MPLLDSHAGVAYESSSGIVARSVCCAGGSAMLEMPLLDSHAVRCALPPPYAPSLSCGMKTEEGRCGGGCACPCPPYAFASVASPSLSCSLMKEEAWFTALLPAATAEVPADLFSGATLLAVEGGLDSSEDSEDSAQELARNGSNPRNSPTFRSPSSIHASSPAFRSNTELLSPMDGRFRASHSYPICIYIDL